MTTEPMKRTVLQMADLKEQTERGYILLPPPGEGIGYIFIDTWFRDDMTITAKAADKIVAVFPIAADWRILDASLINRMEFEASMRLQAESMKATDALKKEIFPHQEVKDPMQEVLDALQQGTKAPGQYL